jgi:hypothetical protein
MRAISVTFVCQSLRWYKLHRRSDNVLREVMHLLTITLLTLNSSQKLALCSYMEMHLLLQQHTW